MLRAAVASSLLVAVLAGPARADAAPIKPYTFGWGLTLGTAYDVRSGVPIRVPSLVPGVPDAVALGLYLDGKVPWLPVFLNVSMNTQGTAVGFLRIPLPTSW